MFDYTIEFKDGISIRLLGIDLNVPEAYRIGYIKIEKEGTTDYYSIHNIDSITEKRVDPDA